jgi:ubiquinone/menaquinone biosynthesis C-methylase UbiE
MSSVNKWKPDLYDHKLDFVSDYGKSVVELLHPLKGEKILDLGCGTGDLSYEIAKSGAHVVGMDLSADMIEKALDKYPQIQFIVGDAERFNMDETFDAVFSNAALHWMKNAEQVVRCIWHALKQGGRFVAEFGGKGNVETIVNAITHILDQEYGIDAVARNPWYFPSIGEYSKLLESQGFHVTYAVHFDRPTRLKDGESGLDDWLTSFGDDFFHDFSETERSAVFKKIASAVKPQLFRNGSWYADYKRIRIATLKP